MGALIKMKKTDYSLYFLFFLLLLLVINILIIRFAYTSILNSFTAVSPPVGYLKIVTNVLSFLLASLVVFTSVVLTLKDATPPRRWPGWRS